MRATRTPTDNSLAAGCCAKFLHSIQGRPRPAARHSSKRYDPWLHAEALGGEGGEPLTRIANLVRQAFSNEESSPNAQEYLKMFVSNMKDEAEAQRRSITFSLLVAIMFELISRAAIADLQVGPLKITKLSLIQEALPVVFSYFIYDICVHSVRYRYTRQTYFEVTRLIQEPLRSTELDRLSVPKGSSLFGPGTLPTSKKEPYLPLTLFTTALRIGYSVTPILIVLYMLWRLRATYGFSDPLPWISLASSIGFLIFTMLVYIDGQRRMDLTLTASSRMLS
jgi:hypothetical protein